MAARACSCRPALLPACLLPSAHPPAPPCLACRALYASPQSVVALLAYHSVLPPPLMLANLTEGRVLPTLAMSPQAGWGSGRGAGAAAMALLTLRLGPHRSTPSTCAPLPPVPILRVVISI